MQVKPALAAAKGGGLLKRGDGAWTAAKTGTWFLTTEDKGLGANPEEHPAWLVRLVQEHATQLRSRLPDVRADLLVHGGDFDPTQLSGNLLRTAVSLGDLEIELPDRGIDIVLTPRNVADYIRDAIQRRAASPHPFTVCAGDTRCCPGGDRRPGTSLNCTMDY